MNSSTSLSSGTADSFSHQVRVLTWLALHATYSELLSREGLGLDSHQKPSPSSTPSKGISPPRKYTSCKSRERAQLRSPSNGWLQSDMSSVDKVDGRSSFTAVSLSGLDCVMSPHASGWDSPGSGILKVILKSVASPRITQGWEMRHIS